MFLNYLFSDWILIGAREFGQFQAIFWQESGRQMAYIIDWAKIDMF